MVSKLYKSVAIVSREVGLRALWPIAAALEPPRVAAEPPGSASASPACAFRDRPVSLSRNLPELAGERPLEPAQMQRYLAASPMKEALDSRLAQTLSLPEFPAGNH